MCSHVFSVAYDFYSSSTRHPSIVLINSTRKYVTIYATIIKSHFVYYISARLFKNVFSNGYRFVYTYIRVYLTPASNLLVRCWMNDKYMHWSMIIIECLRMAMKIKTNEHVHDSFSRTYSCQWAVASRCKCVCVYAPFTFRNDIVYLLYDLFSYII